METPEPWGASLVVATKKGRLARKERGGETREEKDRNYEEGGAESWKRGQKRACSTYDSPVVPHLSTKYACRGLTSQFG